jgi:hypothetical protein
MQKKRKEKKGEEEKCSEAKIEERSRALVFKTSL